MHANWFMHPYALSMASKLQPFARLSVSHVVSLSTADKNVVEYAGAVSHPFVVIASLMHVVRRQYFRNPVKLEHCPAAMRSREHVAAQVQLLAPQQLKSQLLTADSMLLSRHAPRTHTT